MSIIFCRGLICWRGRKRPFRCKLIPPIPRSLSWPVVVLAVLAWLPVKKEIGDWRLEIAGSPISNLQSQKYNRLALTLAALLCLFMVTAVEPAVVGSDWLVVFCAVSLALSGSSQYFSGHACWSRGNAVVGVAQLHNSQFASHNSNLFSSFYFHPSSFSSRFPGCFPVAPKVCRMIFRQPIRFNLRWKRGGWGRRPLLIICRARCKCCLCRITAVLD